MAVLGRIPVVGDELTLPGWLVRVARMDGRRVDRLRFTPVPEEPAGEDGSPTGAAGEPRDEAPA